MPFCHRLGPAKCGPGLIDRVGSFVQEKPSISRNNGGRKFSRLMFAKEEFMAEKIEWQSDLKPAIEQATREHKPILLDFFNPG
jgi:hypothetical protein